MDVKMRFNRNTVPFKMIRPGGCFARKGDTMPYMKLRDNAYVNLLTGEVHHACLGEELIPMRGTCELVEGGLEEDD